MKKILFNDRFGLTQAVLEGRKTMTRRIIKDKYGLYRDLTKCNKKYIHKDNTMRIDFGNMVERRVDLPYKIGEVMAVAQAYETLAYSGTQQLSKMIENSSSIKKEYCGAGWNNKMFVAADLMPHQIRITNIKVERLQDISDEDCLKEGIIQWGDPFHEDRVEDFGFFGATKHYMTAKDAFAALIDNVSGNGTWESNPWVFAYEFKLVK